MQLMWSQMLANIRSLYLFQDLAPAFQSIMEIHMVSNNLI